MKAKDLMIGDWFHNNYTNENYQVWPAFFTQATNFGKRLDATFEDINIAPVPLTPEILEKIGFETQPNIGYIIDDWDGTQIIYDHWNHNLRIIKNYKVCLDIETFDDMAVHELQHALKLCEIEREIVI